MQFDGEAGAPESAVARAAVVDFFPTKKSSRLHFIAKQRRTGQAD
jgi:hypothetical protein